MKKSIKRLYLDLETTGIYHKCNGIIQLAGIMEIDGNITDKFNWKVSLNR